MVNCKQIATGLYVLHYNAACTMYKQSPVCFFNGYLVKNKTEEL